MKNRKTVMLIVMQCMHENGFDCKVEVYFTEKYVKNIILGRRMCQGVIRRRQ